MRVLILVILLSLAGCGKFNAGEMVTVKKACKLENNRSLPNLAIGDIYHIIQADGLVGKVSINHENYRSWIDEDCFDLYKKGVDSQIKDLNEILDISDKKQSKFAIISEYHEFLTLCSEHGKTFHHKEKPVVNSDKLLCQKLTKEELEMELRIVEKYLGSLK